jgi:hypothetical protein
MEISDVVLFKLPGTKQLDRDTLNGSSICLNKLCSEFKLLGGFVFNLYCPDSLFLVVVGLEDELSMVVCLWSVEPSNLKKALFNAHFLLL